MSHTVRLKRDKEKKNCWLYVEVDDNGKEANSLVGNSYIQKSALATYGSTPPEFLTVTITV